jgi:UDP-N-acetyl-D-galactosamine dehydrogenase
MAGYQPQVILAGRRINDGMGTFVAQKTVKLMIGAGQSIKGARVGILGLTFKENCPDLRNSKVADIITELASFGVTVLVHDPLADPSTAKEHYGVDLVPLSEMQGLGAVIIAVAHETYRAMPALDFGAMLEKDGYVVDVKAMLDKTAATNAGLRIWRL